MSGTTIEPNGLDSRYITGPELQEYFVNKRTGAPLAGGKVYFYKDIDHNEAKPVFQLVQGSGNPPQYSYVALPNPMTLSSVGTFVDTNNASIPIYYYPYDVNGNEELYYVVCYDAMGCFQGEFQFSREAWPFPNDISSDITVNSAGIVSNQITNPTFSQVLFVQPSLTINFTGTGNQLIEIAPGWSLYVAYDGTGSVTVTQTPVVGSTNLLNNPPFTLDFTMGANITSIYLQQKLYNNPDWAAANTLEPTGTGWVSGSMLLGPNTTAIMQYVASSGNTTPQVIVDATNTDTTYSQINDTVQLKVANSSQNGSTGYDLIQIVLPNTGTASLSNIQLVSLNENISNVAYEQSTSNRQLSLMFDYFKSKLDYKPIPSYLVGWDFPMNPAQFYGAGTSGTPIGPFNTGPNTSNYFWDNTIVFQTVNNSVSAYRAPSGAFRTVMNAAGGGQLALVGYLPAPQAIEMLSRRKCVMVCSNGSAATVATVSLWYTKGTLPSTVTGHTSIVTQLDANGYPTTNISPTVWIPVPRSGLSNSSIMANAYTNAAQFNIPVAPAGAAEFNQIPLSGWDMQGNTDIENATYFAIVVGTALIAQNAYLDWQAVTCQDGDIPTVPAPKSAAETLLDCQQTIFSTFPTGVVPAVARGVTGSIGYITQVQGSNPTGYGVPIRFPVAMWQTPNPIFYNPVSNNANWRNISQGIDSAAGNALYLSNTGVVVTNSQTSSDQSNHQMSIHALFDGRLGQ